MGGVYEGDGRGTVNTFCLLNGIFINLKSDVTVRMMYDLQMKGTGSTQIRHNLPGKIGFVML
jgi:hypothetical protein